MARHLGITIVAILMVLFGIAEIATGFTHNFVGIINTTQSSASTYGAAIVGAVYAIGGLLLLPMKKRLARVSLFCLGIVVVGRVYLVLTGLYPFTTALQIGSIVVGTLIALIFMVYIGLVKWGSFQP